MILNALQLHRKLHCNGSHRNARGREYCAPLPPALRIAPEESALPAPRARTKQRDNCLWKHLGNKREELHSSLSIQRVFQSC